MELPGAQSGPHSATTAPALQRWRWAAVAAAIIVLGWMAAFVVDGALNDGGWYLIAARLTVTGHLPYRDFLFPQPPLVLYPYGLVQLLMPGLLAGRLTSVVISLAGIALWAWTARQAAGPRAAALILIAFAANPYALYFFTIVKTYPLILLLTGIAAALLVGHVTPPRMAGVVVCCALASMIRLSMLPLLAWLIIWSWRQQELRRARLALAGLAGATLAGAILPFAVPSHGSIWEQLYLPLGTFVNPVTSYYLRYNETYTVSHLIAKKLSSCAKTFFNDYLVIVAAWAAWRTGVKERLTTQARRLLHSLIPGSIAVGILQLTANRPYDEYQTVIFPMLTLTGALLADAAWDDLSRWASSHRWQTLLLLSLSWVAVQRGFDQLDPDAFHPPHQTVLEELRSAAAVVRASTAPGTPVLTLEPYLTVEAHRPGIAAALMGKFAFHPDWSTAQCRRLHVINLEMIESLVRSGSVGAVAIAPHHFTTARPDQPWRMTAIWRRVEALVRRRYRLAASLPRFGLMHDRLDIYVRRPRPHSR